MEILRITSFIAHWQNSGGAERANHQLFLSELCKPFSVTRPETTKLDADNAATLAKTFKSAKTDRIKDILASLGQARALNGWKYVAA